MRLYAFGAGHSNRRHAASESEGHWTGTNHRARSRAGFRGRSEVDLVSAGDSGVGIGYPPRTGSFDFGACGVSGSVRQNPKELQDGLACAEGWFVVPRMRAPSFDALLNSSLIDTFGMPPAREGTSLVCCVFWPLAIHALCPRIKRGLHTRTPRAACVRHNRVKGAVNFEDIQRLACRAE